MLAAMTSHSATPATVPAPAPDPRPVAPREPQLEDCCGSGCVHCVFDIYQMALENHERALREWEARQTAATAPSVRAATALDAARLCAIYNHYVTTTTVSFEEEPVAPADMARRIDDVAAAGLPWLVLEADGVLVGYAYATKWRVRAAYRSSVESTIYLDPAHTGRGHGRLLYGALLAALRDRGLHVVIGGIAQPNAGSVALHERLGFRKVAHFAEIGMKFGRWVDVGYWELRLDLTA
jgi:phosphinothricin acetyltransferase